MADEEDDNKDDGVLDFDPDLSKDGSISAESLINSALVYAQKSLMNSVMKSNVQDGILAFSMFIDYIEVLAESKKYINEEYFKKIKEYQQTQEYKEIKREDVKMGKLAKQKLRLMLCAIFDTAPIDEPMKV